MILEDGCVVFITHRRMFEADHSRMFVGIVDGYEAGITKVTGYSWVKNQYGGNYLKKSEKRTKIFSINSGLYFIYQLPSDVDVENLHIETAAKGEARMKDDKNFEMDLSESFPQVARNAKDYLG